MDESVHLLRDAVFKECACGGHGRYRRKVSKMTPWGCNECGADDVCQCKEVVEFECTWPPCRIARTMGDVEYSMGTDSEWRQERVALMEEVRELRRSENAVQQECRRLEGLVASILDKTRRLE